MSPSYGYSYLTSYGWTGTGAGLRSGAIAKPIAIPPKKNLNGLGKDRDDAFPFWDHLFTAAAKAITIKISSDSDDDSEDADESKDLTEQPPTSLTRTTTGILSNRPPILGTPASTSGSTTPSLNTDVDVLDTGVAGRPSLLVTAKREAAKRGLYARFFRGPVLGRDDPPHFISSQSLSVSTTVPEHVGERENIVGNEKQCNKKRKSEVKEETREERRERKRIRRERKAAKVAKRAAKALVGDKAYEKKDRKSRKRRFEETYSEEPRLRKTARNQAQECAESAQGGRNGLQEGRTHRADGQQDTSSHTPCNVVNETGALNVVLTTKKKKGKRKNTPT